MTPRTITIRQSLIGIQLAGILGLGLLFFATTFLGTRGTVEGLLDSMMRRTMDETVRELYAFFAPTARAQGMASEWIESGLLDTLNPDDVHRLALSFLQQNEAIQSFVLTDDLGNEHRVTRAENDWLDTIVRPVESSFQRQFVTWQGEGVRKEGRWASSDVDPRLQGWYQQALELFAPDAGQVLESQDADAGVDVEANVRADTAPPATNLFISTPYLRQDGQLGVTTALANQAPDGRLKVVAFEQQLGALLDFTRSLDFSERGGVFLLDNDFRLLVIPEGEQFWQGGELGWQLLRPSDLGSSVVSDLLDSLSQSDTPGEAIRFRSEGELWWANIRQVPIGPDNNLVATVVVPDQELFGARTSTRRWILGLTLGAVLLAVGAAWTTARRLSQPIEELVGSSNRLRRGDLEARTPISTPLVEIRSLVDAQEEMRRGLRSILKLEGDLRVARQIQQSTLPSELPEISGYELAAWSEPAEETGGDTYDLAWATDARGQRVLHLLLADASGHGVGPALAVTQLRAMIRMALRLGGDIETVARHLNEQLYADLPSNRFITAWLAELDPHHHILATLSAGQGPLLYYQATTGRVQQLVADAPPFGLFPELAVRPREALYMQPGDLYVVLSDGFFEASDSSGREIGRETIAKIVEAHAEGSAEQLLEQLRFDVGSIESQSEAKDDRTAVILKRVGDIE